MPRLHSKSKYKRLLANGKIKHESTKGICRRTYPISMVIIIVEEKAKACVTNWPLGLQVPTLLAVN